MRAEAGELLGRHPLRAADSLQLAAARVWALRPAPRDTPAGFVAYDVRLREAAAEDGFTLFPERLRPHG